MEFRKVTPLGRPNLWADRPMIEVWLGAEHHATRRATDFESFHRLWSTWLPLMPDPTAAAPLPARRAPASGAPTGIAPDALLESIEQGASIAELLLGMTLRLQRIACGRTDLTLAFVAPWQHGARIAIEYDDEALARLCLQCAGA